MRRQTQWALGGVLAGTMMLGVTGTLAVFSDTEQVTVQVGASALGLGVTTQPAADAAMVGRASSPGTVLRAAMTGDGPATLRLSVVPDSTAAACAEHPEFTMTVRVPQEGEVAVPLCGQDPAQLDHGLPIAVLSTELPTAEVVVLGLGGAGGAAVRVTPVLRFSLSGTEGGFSDRTDVPVSLTSVATAPSSGRPGVDAEPSGPAAGGQPADGSDTAEPVEQAPVEDESIGAGPVGAEPVPTGEQPAD